MREIKFRGWNPKNKCWLHGFYLQNRRAHFVCPDEFAHGKSWDDYELLPETLGQFTGLTDKNGREIYEGDVVCLNGIIDAVVIYKYGSFSMNAINNATDFYFAPWEQKDYEVLGNIHDNPELLK